MVFYCVNINLLENVYHTGVAVQGIIVDIDRYFIDRKEVIADLFVIEMREIYVHVYTRLLTCQKIM